MKLATLSLDLESIENVSGKMGRDLYTVPQNTEAGPGWSAIGQISFGRWVF